MYVFISALKWHCQAQGIRVTHSAVPCPVTEGKAPLSSRAPGRRQKEEQSQKRLIITDTHPTRDAHLLTVLKQKGR